MAIDAAIRPQRVRYRTRATPRRRLALLSIAAVLACAVPSAQERNPGQPVTLRARIVATGAGPAASRQPELPGQLPADAADDERVATALLRRSPRADGALFAVVRADGSVVQVKAERNLGPLLPAGTIAPLSAERAARKKALSASGVVFNWVPDPILYVADPTQNAVLALKLSDDGRSFHVDSAQRLAGAELNRPVALAPAVVESLNPSFSSSTTLAGEADLYVANRGNGTVARMGQDGSVVAVRRIEVPGLGVLGAGWLSGIVSATDAARIWVSLGGPIPARAGLDGAILELPAFAADRVAERSLARARKGSVDAANGSEVALLMGLGPAFNGRSCADCHASPVAGGMGANGLATVMRIGRLDGRGYDPMLGRGGPVARRHAVSELGLSCALVPGIPTGANLISIRNAPALFGLGQVDAIPDATILAGAKARANGVHGHPNIVPGADGRPSVGKFGWKAEIPQLQQFVANALRDEHGITSPLAPDDLTPAVAAGPDCGTGGSPLKDDGALVTALTGFVRSLDPLPPRTQHAAGSAIFVKTGCAGCHTPSLAAGAQSLALYSDLLLHDMGAALNDGVVQGQAQGSDWRTTPLWGLSARARFLHDGRARSIDAAILAHGGEAETVVQAYRKLDRKRQIALLSFLSSL